jgi:hypothetical protein
MNWFFYIQCSSFLLVLILSPLFAIFTAAFEIVTTNTVPPGATHVQLSTLHAPRAINNTHHRLRHLLCYIARDKLHRMKLGVPYPF